MKKLQEFIADLLVILGMLVATTSALVVFGFMILGVHYIYDFVIADVSTNTISATRVAHDETRAELADTLGELGNTLMELHEYENKPTN